MVSDVAAGTAFQEIVGGDGGQVQGIIQFSEGQESGIGGDGSAAKLQADFGIELEPERGFFAVSGKEVASRLPRPLRTGHESFPSSGSSRVQKIRRRGLRTFPQLGWPDRPFCRLPGTLTFRSCVAHPLDFTSLSTSGKSAPFRGRPSDPILPITGRPLLPPASFTPWTFTTLAGC